MTTLLIVTTWLAGAAWGPAVQMQPMATVADCNRIGRSIVETVDLSGNAGNVVGPHKLENGVTAQGRTVVVFRCEPLKK